MQNPQEFYSAEIQQFETKLSLLKKQLTTSSSLRLLVFLAIPFSESISFLEIILLWA